MILRDLSVITMFGAVAGDIIGSLYEFTEQKRYDFELLPQGSQFTDDTVMTIAVAHWLAHYDEEGLIDEQLITTIQEFGRKYPLIQNYIYHDIRRI